MRDEKWLYHLLAEIREKYFPDTRGNTIKIKFGRPSRTRLGSITLRKKGQENRRLLRNEARNISSDDLVSVITINPLLAHGDVPDKITLATIVHEFIHYAQGFNSAIEQNIIHPHRGNIMQKEFSRIGLVDLYFFQKNWLKENWISFLQKRHFH
ncbi:hypothetical protein HYV44_00780 [Candidatus Microgenomates bacterium]|nr:hypothetical protein [Candidatus Microgenomates bacterium]